MVPKEMEASSEEQNYPRSRNPRACDACRSSKSRCLASEQPNICQKCLKSRLTCFVRATARPRRAKKRNIIVNELDSRDLGKLECDEGSEHVYMKLDSIPFVNRDACLAALEQHHQDVFDQLLPPTSQNVLPATSGTSAQTCQSQSASVAGLEQVTKQQLLTIDQAEKLLQYFSENGRFFPFVVLPQDATVKSLSRKSPFLLLAILTAASAADIQLNYQLDHEFKRVLSQRVILEGQKSLDYLQGLLVYNAWYPCHLRPKNRQTFMYINVAISLADDLGLAQRCPNVSNLCPENVNYEGLYGENGFSKAAQRAYLGCYYLSSAISMGFQKQSALKYSDLMGEYGSSLAEDAEIWSDLSLLPLVRSNDIEERILAAHSRQYGGNSFKRSAFEMDMQIQAFHDEIEDWRRCIPEEIKSLPLMVLTERFLFMSLFSQDLACIRPSPGQASQHYSPVQLSKCLEANKKYFETLLSIPAVQYQGFTNIQWCQMIHAIIVLSRLSSPMPRCPSWDAHAARDHAPLGMFLDCLCYRLQELSSAPQGNSKPKNPDGPFIFRMVLESIKKSHERRVAATPLKPAQGVQGASYCNSFEITDGSSPERLRCPMVDPNLMTYLEPIKAGLNPSCYSSKTGTITIYHDLWATMTMSWTAD